jgi:hypothetical protein
MMLVSAVTMHCFRCNVLITYQNVFCALIVRFLLRVAREGFPVGAAREAVAHSVSGAHSHGQQKNQRHEWPRIFEVNSIYLFEVLV